MLLGWRLDVNLCLLIVEWKRDTKKEKTAKQNHLVSIGSCKIDIGVHT